MTLNQLAKRLRRIENYKAINICTLARIFSTTESLIVDASDHIEYLKWKEENCIEYGNARFVKNPKKATLFK